VRLKRVIAPGLLVALAASLLIQLPLAIADRSAAYEWFDPIIDIRRILVDRYVSEPDQAAMQEAMIDAMIEVLDDPYTQYVPPAATAEFNKQLRGTYAGIGAEVNIVDGYLVIVSPMDDSPALHAGVMAGDTVLEIEGESTFELPVDACVDRLTGEAGTPVSIKVRHLDGSEEDLSITRKRIVTRTVKGLRRIGEAWSYCVDADLRLQYLRVTQFNASTIDELRAALDGLIEEGLGGLILDLRDNPGGGLPTAVAMTDLFLREGLIVSVRPRVGDEVVYRANEEGTLPDFPMVVLVNGNSASASEIVSGALQDNGRAKVIGTRTFGKGSVQEVRGLNYGSGTLKFTAAHYYLPSGRNINRVADGVEWGVDPDPGYVIAVSDDEYLDGFRARREFEIIREPEEGTERCVPVRLAVVLRRRRRRGRLRPGAPTDDGRPRASDRAAPTHRAPDRGAGDRRRGGGRRAAAAGGRRPRRRHARDPRSERRSHRALPHRRRGSSPGARRGGPRSSGADGAVTRTAARMASAPLILGIESSCDETAAAVAAGPRRVLSNVIATQHALHERYAGVVPEIASRAHLERILPVVQDALADADVRPADLAAVAVGHRPGLIGSLLVGVAAAKTLAWSCGIPLIGVDHVHAHLHAALLDGDDDGDAPYPALGLVVSGGHTALYLVRDALHLTRLGATIDDAAGEAFDKTATVLQLGYPGGPAIDRLAGEGNDRAHDFPVAALGRESLDFSFSGLKTAVLYAVRGRPEGRGAATRFPRDATSYDRGQRADFAASFQRAAVTALVRAVRRAHERHPEARTLLVGGGVSANRRLRADLAELAATRGLALRLPTPELCLDNAAMIATLAAHRLAAGAVDDLGLTAATSSLIRS
jgi:N6-L-threonylcarbamoyladenine synthase